MMREVKKRTNIWGGKTYGRTEKEDINTYDDSEMNREILVSMLEDEYDLIQAEDGTAGGLYYVRTPYGIIPAVIGYEYACNEWI